MDKKIRERIREVQSSLEAPASLNILNGQLMYDDFKEAGLMLEGDYMPFNEALALGPLDKNVFSQEFFEKRRIYHRLDIWDYEKISLEPMKKLLEVDYESIVLWFGDDLFCQINLLAILAYLEENFQGQVYLNLVDERTYNIRSSQLEVSDYSRAYAYVSQKKKGEFKALGESMDRALKLYFELLREDNRLTKYIEARPDMSDRELLISLMENFSYIGYGDRQYMELIDRQKNKP